MNCFQTAYTTRTLGRIARIMAVGLLLASTANWSGTAYGQNTLPPPPGMTFSCSPNPIFQNDSATCTVYAGGGATGSVTISVGGNVVAPPLPLNSSGTAVFTTGPLNPPVGLLVATASYSGDANYAPAQVSGVLSVYNTGIHITAETLTCSPYVLYSNGNGTVSPTCMVYIPGGATGQVTFTVDGNAWTTSPVNTSTGIAVATQGPTNLTVGVHTIGAVYSGDDNFYSFATNTTLSVTGTQMQPKSISVGCTPFPVAQGAAGSCQVRTTGGATGSVSLYVNNQSVGSAQTLDSSGSATFSNLFSSLLAGSYGVQAFYSGDGNFSPAAAGTTINVGTGTSSPLMSVTCTPGALTFGQLTACTAHLRAGVTGNVAFTIDGTPWGSAAWNASGSASLSGGMSGASLGTHLVMATYGGDANFGSSSATANVQVSNQTTAPTVTLTCSPTTVVIPNNTNCYVSVPGGATGSVVLYLNGYPDIGQSLDGHGHAVFQNPLFGFATGATGPVQLSASYLGDLNFSTGSASTSVQLSAQPVTPTLTPSITPSTIQNGGHITFTANVSSGATGNVTVTTGGQTIAVLPLSPRGNATGSLDFNGASATGSYTFLFSYSGDANFNPVSQTATLTLSPQGTGNPTPPTGPTTPASGSVLYSYSITQPGTTISGYAPNGNIVAYTDSVNGQWTAGYDPLNRVVSASQAPTGTTGSNVTGQFFCWSYDSFGNRILQARAPGTLSNCVATNANGENYISAAYNTSNQLTSVSGEAVIPGVTGSWTLPPPDASGNTSADPNNQYWYDGEGRVCAEQSMTGFGAVTAYLYDADGNRVAKGTITPPSGTDPCDISTNGFRISDEYILGPNGEQLTELQWSTGTAIPVHINAFAGGQLVATYAYNSTSQTSALHFQFSDWLGTRRLQTDANGNPEESFAGGTFGDQLAPLKLQTNAADATEQHFTGKERDTESGLDYFGARYYSSVIGRFSSPDWASKPEGVPYSALDNPQTLNLYAYVGNNPLGRADADGHNWLTDHLKSAAVGVLKGIGILATAQPHFTVTTTTEITGVNVESDVNTTLEQINGAIPEVFKPNGLTESLAAAGTVAAATLTGVGEEIEAIGAVGREIVSEGLLSFDQAREAAFGDAGLNGSNTIFTRQDPATGTITEFRTAEGGRVVYDGPHPDPGPSHDVSHVGSQTPGKRADGGRVRQNRPYSGTPHPSGGEEIDPQ